MDASPDVTSVNECTHLELQHDVHERGMIFCTGFLGRFVLCGLAISEKALDRQRRPLSLMREGFLESEQEPHLAQIPD